MDVFISTEVRFWGRIFNFDDKNIRSGGIPIKVDASRIFRFFVLKLFTSEATAAETHSCLTVVDGRMFDPFP